MRSRFHGTIFPTDVGILEWWRADIGTQLVAGNVQTWTGYISGTVLDDQGTSGNRPPLNTSTASLYYLDFTNAHVLKSTNPDVVLGGRGDATMFMVGRVLDNSSARRYFVTYWTVDDSRPGAGQWEFHTADGRGGAMNDLAAGQNNYSTAETTGSAGAIVSSNFHLYTLRSKFADGATSAKSILFDDVDVGSSEGNGGTMTGNTFGNTIDFFLSVGSIPSATPTTGGKFYVSDVMFCPYLTDTQCTEVWTFFKNLRGL